MDKYIYIGKIVGTHGIKGELKIISDFERKDLIFKTGLFIYIDKEYNKTLINSYRQHKNYDMVTINNLNNINDVLKYKGKEVYINRNELTLNDDEYLYADFIGMEVYNQNDIIGIVTDYLNNNGNYLLEIKSKKIIYIPINNNFIDKVDLKDNKVYLKNIEGLI